MSCRLCHSAGMGVFCTRISTINSLASLLADSLELIGMNIQRTPY